MNLEVYVCLRPAHTDEGYIIVGLAKDKNGPFFVFKKENRHPVHHPLLVAKLGSISIRHQRNVKIKLQGPLLKAYYNTEAGYFWFKGREKLIQVISLEPVGHEYSFVENAGSSVCDPSFVSTANYDQYAVRFDTVPTDLTISGTAMDSSMASLNSTLRTPTAPDNSFNDSYSQPNVIQPVHHLTVNQIRSFTDSMRNQKFVTFDPMDHEIVLWIDAFEKHLLIRNALAVARDILVEFLDCEVGLPFYFKVIE